MDLNVLPECYIDTKLVKAAVPPQTRYNHQKGTNVLKVMDEKLGDKFALGIVDEDMLERKYASQFSVQQQNILGKLCLLKHTHRHHYLILLCPAIEKWIITCAEEINLNLEDFGLPHNVDMLRKITKTSKSEHDDPYSENFQRLFKAMKMAPGMMVLALWIQKLKENPYNIDLNVLAAQTQVITASH